ncbi:YciI family protein [Mesorhizobium sp.]|uniref:YciI family protein n=1 Tax=Mesorhizobium sp. TaxID=1871066 RepID=UPI00257A96F5|nr:YciI family protein [Mesorhizobium sp.]
MVETASAETRELVAGFWLWEFKDMDEAVAWVKRCPNPMPGPSKIEIRPLYGWPICNHSDAGGHGNP